ncbi:hypothetical protein CU098_012898 [Rhizopus stolonifer]|uniref:Uncharacterized protein n=1 Tax=Rhizopus stolonifer TaxID=4846 RepID=A0A367KT43_RHIST|nr:hypothetical protein CU098_012898 [Rhizopus stolonifer]
MAIYCYHLRERSLFISQYQLMSYQQRAVEYEKVINKLENNLRYLLDDWKTLDIVFQSVLNAFDATKDTTEQHLDDVDRELSIAYDELMAQVRQLDRRLKKMALEINQALVLSSSSSTPIPLAIETDREAFKETQGGKRQKRF